MGKENKSDVFYMFTVNGKGHSAHYASEIQAELEASMKMVEEGATEYVMYECRPLDISKYVHANDVLDGITMYMDADENGNAYHIFSDVKEADLEELSKRLTDTISSYFMESHDKNFFDIIRSWTVRKVATKR